MSFIETTSRIIRTTIQHFTRNFWHPATAVFVIALTMYSVSYFSAAGFKYSQALTELKQKPQITAFFKDETGEDYILDLKKELEKNPQVKGVSYTSKEEALKYYQKQHEDQPELLEFVTADILPASLEISTKEVETQQEVARSLANNINVESVIFHRDVVKKLQELSSSVRVEGLAWSASLILVSVLTILVVVGMNISSFGKEIEVMRLVGATAWYIRWPFILEGIVYGVAASILSMALLVLMPYVKGATVGTPTLSFLPAISVFPIPPWLLLRLWAATSVGGSVLGVVGSMVAIWRYLRV